LLEIASVTAKFFGPIIFTESSLALKTDEDRKPRRENPN